LLGFNLTEAKVENIDYNLEIDISESVAISEKEVQNSLKELTPLFEYVKDPPAVILEKTKNPLPSLILEEKYVLEAPATNLIDKNQETPSQKSSRPSYYIVQKGDTISKIAQKFNVSILTIKSANNLSSDLIKPGQRLYIPPASGIVYTVKRGDTLIGIVSRFGGDLKATIKKNNLKDAATIFEGQKILIVGAKKYPVSTVSSRQKVASWFKRTFQRTSYQTARYYGPAVGSGSFRRPTNGLTITQYYHWYHRAIDIDWRSGRNIYAADAGKVIAIRRGWAGGYGNCVDISHGNGYVTRYAHLSKILVSIGQTVYKGQIIGIMGRTGRATGVHLHFEIMYHGVKLNPLRFIK